MIFFAALIVAIIPVFFWYFILIRKQRKGMKFFFFLTIGISALFAFFWKQYIEAPALLFIEGITGLLLSIFIIGAIIEYGKNTLVRLIGGNYIKTINDAVDLSFATALGFSSIENFFVFYDLFIQPFSYGSPIEISKIVLTQELFVLPIHILCSRFFGYYYGVSLFAKEEYRHSFQSFFKPIQILKGTIISIFIYGSFFFIKEKDFRISDISHLFGLTPPPHIIDEKLLLIFAFFMFSIGSYYFFKKMQERYLIEDTPNNT